MLRGNKTDGGSRLFTPLSANAPLSRSSTPFDVVTRFLSYLLGTFSSRPPRQGNYNSGFKHVCLTLLSNLLTLSLCPTFHCISFVQCSASQNLSCCGNKTDLAWLKWEIRDTAFRDTISHTETHKTNALSDLLFYTTQPTPEPARSTKNVYQKPLISY